jgi:hypothetical protein
MLIILFWELLNPENVRKNSKAYLQALEVYLQTLEVHLQTLEVYLQTLEVNLQTLKVYLQTLEVYLQTLKVYLQALKVYLQKEWATCPVSLKCVPVKAYMKPLQPAFTQPVASFKKRQNAVTN